MKPIFFLMAAGAMGLLGYAGYVGLRVSYGGEAGAESIGRHFVLGLTSGVVVSLLHSVVLVYFLGTGKAIKEQIEKRGWEEDFFKTQRKYMGQAVIPSSIGILLVVGVAFLGGFTLIGMLPREVHLVAAIVGVGGQMPVMWRQWGIIRRNGELMDEVSERMEREGV